MSTYTVRAVRWEHGWELHIDGVGVTQARTLDGAPGMVRDYIESLTGHDASGDEVVIQPDLGGLEDKATVVREWTERVQRETVEAAAASRDLARDLRKAGLSVSDTAAVLGVSRGRVSQLTGGEPEEPGAAATAQRRTRRRNANRSQEIRDWAAKNLYAAEDSTVAAKD